MLELSSISWREIFEFQKITFWRKPRNKSRWKCSDSISPIFQNLQFDGDVSIVSEPEYQRQGRGFVHSQISKYLNYSIAAKLTLLPWSVPLCRSIIVALWKFFPTFFCFISVAKLKSCKHLIFTWQLIPVVSCTHCNLSSKFTSRIFPRKLTLHYLCSSLPVSKPAQGPTLLFCCTDFRGHSSSLRKMFKFH